MAGLRADKSVDDSRHLFTWAAGLEEGFFLEISVPSKVDIHGNMELAEMSVDLQSGRSRWYGGGTPASTTVGLWIEHSGKLVLCIHSITGQNGFGLCGRCSLGSAVAAH
jgi:hypothetical protein